MASIRTGKLPHDYLELHRRLLSEYNPDLGLEKYVKYIELKDVSKKTQIMIEKKKKEVIAELEADLVKSNATAAAAGDNKKKELTETMKINAVSLALDADEDIQASHDKGFEILHQSYDLVRTYLKEADEKVLRDVQALKRETEEVVQSKGEDRLIALFAEAQSLINYRTLNCDLLGMMLQKYLERCAVDSLLVQRKVHYCDDRISESCIALPTFDIDAKKQFIVSAYAVAFKCSFEVALDIIKKRCYYQRLSHRHRLLPTHEAYYFTQHTAFNRVTHEGFTRKVLSGTTSGVLCKSVAELLRTDLIDTKIGAFANGEVSIKIQEAVRGKDVFVVQSMTKTNSASLSTVLMELFLLFQCLQLASVGRATAVLPYIAYTNKTNEMSAIAEMLELMGCHQVITVDMFNEQVEGFFEKSPVENLPAKKEFVKYVSRELSLEGHSGKDIVVVAGDSHTVARARSFADALSRSLGGTYVGLATAVRRVRNSVLTNEGSCKTGAFLDEVYLTGDVDGKMCIILDCILDEGVNLATIAKHLKGNGATRVKAVITHALFSGDCGKRIVESEIEELIVSDSICQDEQLANPELAKKLRVLPLGPLISEAIDRIHTENTLSTLFDGRK